MPKDSPGDWNQALMELGATVCTPDSPSCGVCPLSKECVAFKKGLQDRLPLPEARRAPVPVRWTCLWIERDGKLLIWKRSEKERLLKNLWCLPEAQRVSAQPGRRLGAVSHSITHHALTVELHVASMEKDARCRRKRAGFPPARPRPPGLLALAQASAHRRRKTLDRFP